MYHNRVPFTLSEISLAAKALCYLYAHKRYDIISRLPSVITKEKTL